MPLQNQVTPFGELIAAPTKAATLFGNKGNLHDANGRIRRFANGRRWISCLLEFKGRHRHPLLQPGKYTELFFLDEPTAMAAGHRPCRECRRDAFEAFCTIWVDAVGPLGSRRADEIDQRLHAERLISPGVRRVHVARAENLPDGAFVLLDGAPYAVAVSGIRRWRPDGYDAPLPRPSGDVELLTPPSLAAVLRGGYWLGP
jgi:hypothetical protein